MQNNTFRDNGTVGALLDEYEKAVNELIAVLEDVSREELFQIVDHETKDPDCVSIQSILTHIVQSGFNYVVEIRRWLGEEPVYRDTVLLSTISEYQAALRDMFDFNVQLFDDHPKLPLWEKNPEKKVITRWKQRFDVEQLFSHAILHVLKHRRQIQRFILKMR